MTTIGVGVEGPSDLRFWRKYLHRTFADRRFDVRNMSGRPRLIKQAPRLLDAFRSLRYRAGIIILDLDKNPCVSDLIAQFDEPVQCELRRPLADRYLHICVAVRKIESWFLADREAVTAVLPGAEYEVSCYTNKWGKRKLGELCRNIGLRYNELWFAEEIAPEFCATRAMTHSSSLALAWERIANAVGAPPSHTETG